MIMGGYPSINTEPAWGIMFSLCVIHKVDLCPNNGDINRLMMTFQ
jgi:hypothetical protein